MSTYVARAAPKWCHLVVGVFTGVSNSGIGGRPWPRGKLFCLESCARDAAGQPWTEPPGEVPEWSNGAAC